MTSLPKSESLATRRAKQERAQAAAIEEIAIKAKKRREQSERLRQLRLANKNARAARFRAWRSHQEKSSA